MGYIKIGEQIFDALIETAKKNDAWDGRETASVTLTMSAENAKGLFADGIAWYCVGIDSVGEYREKDMSAYSMAGDVIDHRDGTVIVLMGKPTATEELTNALEQAYGLLYGGDAV